MCVSSIYKDELDSYSVRKKVKLPFPILFDVFLFSCALSLSLSLSLSLTHTLLFMSAKGWVLVVCLWAECHEERVVALEDGAALKGTREGRRGEMKGEEGRGGLEGRQREEECGTCLRDM